MHYTLNPLKKIFPLSMVNFSWHLTKIKHFMNILPGKCEPQASIFFQFKLFKWNIKTKVFQKEPADFLSGKQNAVLFIEIQSHNIVLQNSLSSFLNATSICFSIEINSMIYLFFDDILSSSTFLPFP